MNPSLHGIRIEFEFSLITPGDTDKAMPFFNPFSNQNILGPTSLFNGVD